MLLTISSQALAFLSQQTNEVYQFLSGVPVSPATRFLSLRDVDERRTLEDVLHYMHYALAAYGWPMFLMTNAGCGLCRILPSLRYVRPRDCVSMCCRVDECQGVFSCDS